MTLATACRARCTAAARGGARSRRKLGALREGAALGGPLSALDGVPRTPRSRRRGSGQRRVSRRLPARGASRARAGGRVRHGPERRGGTRVRPAQGVLEAEEGEEAVGQEGRPAGGGGRLGSRRRSPAPTLEVSAWMRCATPRPGTRRGRPRRRRCSRGRRWPRRSSPTGRAGERRPARRRARRVRASRRGGGGGGGAALVPEGRARARRTTATPSALS